MRWSNVGWWLAGIPLLAAADVRVERTQSLVMDSAAPLQAGDVLLAYRVDGRRVAIDSAFDLRLAQALHLPGKALQMELRRAEAPTTATLSFGVADIDIRADSERSPAGILDQAWIDAITAQDWPLTHRLRDQALLQWQAAAAEFARLRGATTLFAERDFDGCVAWIETQDAQVRQPLLRAQWLEQLNHCIGYSGTGDWRRGSAALDQASELLADAAPHSLLKARIDALRAQILSFSDGVAGRAQVEAAIAAGLTGCGRCEAVGVMYQQAGDVYSNVNAYAESERAYRESVTYARALHADSDSLAMRLRPMARALRVMGHYDEAWSVASEALAAMRASTMPESAQIPFINGLGTIAANRGDFHLAAEQQLGRTGQPAEADRRIGFSPAVQSRNQSLRISTQPTGEYRLQSEQDGRCYCHGS